MWCVVARHDDYVLRWKCVFPFECATSFTQPQPPSVFFESPRQLRVGSMASQLTDDEIARLRHTNDVECAIRIRMACGIAEPEDGTTTRATTTATTTVTGATVTGAHHLNDHGTTWY